MHSQYTALLDSCVLYPAQLRDLLLTLYQTGLFRARWTDQIHDEWIQAVLRDRPELGQRLERTRARMNEAGLDCLVTGYEPLIDSLALPDPGDRHVLAAAIRSAADVIVTINLRHFPDSVLEPFGLEVQHPDDFVLHQISLSQEVALAAIGRQRRRLSRPPRSVSEFLDSLERHVPKTVSVLRTRTDSL